MHSSMFSWYQTKLHMLTVVHWLVERTMSVCTWIGGNKGVPSKGGVNRRHIKMLVLQTSTRQGLLEKKVYFPRTDLHRQAIFFTSSGSWVHCCWSTHSPVMNPGLYTCVSTGWQRENRPAHQIECIDCHRPILRCGIACSLQGQERESKVVAPLLHPAQWYLLGICWYSGWIQPCWGNLSRIRTEKVLTTVSFSFHSSLN